MKLELVRCYEPPKKRLQGLRRCIALYNIIVEGNNVIFISFISLKCRCFQSNILAINQNLCKKHSHIAIYGELPFMRQEQLMVNGLVMGFQLVQKDKSFDAKEAFGCPNFEATLVVILFLCIHDEPFSSTQPFHTNRLRYTCFFYLAIIYLIETSRLLLMQY